MPAARHGEHAALPLPPSEKQRKTEGHGGLTRTRSCQSFDERRGLNAPSSPPFRCRRRAADHSTSSAYYVSESSLALVNTASSTVAAFGHALPLAVIALRRVMSTWFIANPDARTSIDRSSVACTLTLMSLSLALHLTVAPASWQSRARVRSVGTARDRNLPDRRQQREHKRSRMMVRKRCGFTVNSGDVGDPPRTKLSHGPECDLKWAWSAAHASTTVSRKWSSHVATRQAQLLWNFLLWSDASWECFPLLPRHPVAPSTDKLGRRCCVILDNIADLKMSRAYPVSQWRGPLTVDSTQWRRGRHDQRNLCLLSCRAN